VAERADLPDDVNAALAGVQEATARQERESARRVQAVSLALAGFTNEQIGKQLGIEADSAKKLVQRSLQTAEARNVEEMRALENQRLDRAQAAIWSNVVAGDLKSVQAFLAISKQRAQINGLNAPTKIEVNVGIRNEMERALENLETMVLEASTEGVYALPAGGAIIEAEEA
jgi:hypothetical protein